MATVEKIKDAQVCGFCGDYIYKNSVAMKIPPEENGSDKTNYACIECWVEAQRKNNPK